jgi:hypothetical protein
MPKLTISLALIFSLLSFNMHGQVVDINELKKAKEKVGDAFFENRKELQEFRLQQEKNNAEERRRQARATAEGLSKLRTPDSTTNRKTQQRTNLNVYLRSQEAVIGANLCHYSDGSTQRIGGGRRCPRNPPL